MWTRRNVFSPSGSGFVLKLSIYIPVSTLLSLLSVYSLLLCMYHIMHNIIWQPARLCDICRHLRRRCSLASQMPQERQKEMMLLDIKKYNQFLRFLILFAKDPNSICNPTSFHPCSGAANSAGYNIMPCQPSWKGRPPTKGHRLAECGRKGSEICFLRS